MGSLKRYIQFGIPHISRFNICPLLESNGGLPLSVERDGSLKGRNYSPECFFDIDSKLNLSGWFMVELLVEAEQSYLNTSFLLQHKGGCNSTFLGFPVRSGTLTKRLIWFPRGGENLVFNLGSSTCNFSITKFSFIKVSTLFALNRMRSRLARRYLSVPDKLCERWVRYNRTFQAGMVNPSYLNWIKNLEPSFYPVKKSKNKVVTEFILLMPLNDRANFSDVESTVQSIFDQSRTDWSLFILYSEPIDIKLIVSLKKLEKDSRIQVKESSSLTCLIKVWERSYCLTISPNLFLAPKALDTFAEAAGLCQKTHVFYSDEDSITEAGRRKNPKFKPAWNIDLFYSKNYIGECMLFSPGVLGVTNICSTLHEEAWDFSLLLDAINVLGLDRIIVSHIPRVLCHFRNNTRRDETAYLSSCTKTISRYFGNSKLRDVNIKFQQGESSIHLSWPIPDKQPLVSLLIPTRDKLSILRLCVDSILKKTTYDNYEIIILDNQSADLETIAYFDQLKSEPKVSVLCYDAPFNYSAINNFGVSHARGDIIGLINNDVEVISSDWLTEMVGHAIRPDIGCVGAKLFYGDGRIQHAGVVIGLGGLAGHAHKFHDRGDSGYMDRLTCTQNFSAVTAACLLIQKSIFNEVNGLNEEVLKVAFNDVDLCLKVLNSGYRNVWTPWAKLYHHESISRGRDDTREKRSRFNKEARYLRKHWVSKMTTDPCYSPFLTHVREDFSIGLYEARDTPLVR